MVRTRDSDSGQFQQSATDAEIIQFVRENGPIGSSDVAEEFDIATGTAYRRLRELDDRGKVDSLDVGPTLVWSLDE
jgi:DeoR/GlpR family transcriptional regulator of sugar metabolism